MLSWYLSHSHTTDTSQRQLQKVSKNQRRGEEECEREKVPPW